MHSNKADSINSYRMWDTVRDFASIIIVLLLSFYVVYFTSPDVSRLFFLLLLLLFLITRRDYFWFAYFFILAQGPGYFFADFAGSSLYRLPLYTIMSGYSATPLDLFVVLALAKALIRGKMVRLSLAKPLIVIAVYIASVALITTITYGTDISYLSWHVRWVIYYSIIVSFLYLVNTKKGVYRFILLLFPLTFFIFACQIYYAIWGSEMINLFNPGYRGVTLNLLTGEVRPLVAGILLVFFSFIFSLFLLENRECKLTKVYLYVIICVAFLSVFLSATRIWFVTFSFIFLGYILVSKKKFASILGVVAMVCLVVSILSYFNVLTLDILWRSSWMRLQQVASVASGDIQSVDTAKSRFIDRLPIMIEIIKQNPIIGYGFSPVTMSFYNNDLGFVNTILMFGFVGLFLFMAFFAKLLSLLIMSIRQMNSTNYLKVPLKIMVIGWISMLIGYFTTVDHFTIYFERTFFVAILIALTEFFILEARKDETYVYHSSFAVSTIIDRYSKGEFT